MTFSRIIVLCLCVGLPALLQAEVKLAHVFSNHAVLQRDMPIRIWGTAFAGESVTVGFHGQTHTAIANQFGEWQVFLRPERAGGPFVLEVTGNRSSAPQVREDILVGDVWIASGQSNMAFPLKGFSDAPLSHSDEEIAHSNQPKLRLLLQTMRTSATELGETDDSWTVCTPETAKDFSAVAYFFGREIANREHVPIGLIDTTWGGTPVQAWISLSGIAANDLLSVASDGARVLDEESEARQREAWYKEATSTAAARGEERPPSPPIRGDHAGSWTPGGLFNGMVAPFTQYTIKGVLWYQGEQDATPDRAPHYRRNFSALILDWRAHWAQGAFPFLFVQISSFGKNDNDWGTVRDAQRRVSQDVANTGMAVTLDVGSPTNIHPPDKQTVAARLALYARGRVYGEEGIADPPIFVSAVAEGDSMRVYLDHAEGLRANNAQLTDFEVAGEDRKFVPAKAVIDGGTIVVHSSELTGPVYVRYGWRGTVNTEIYNAAGLPLSTFTSEP